jgi:hypothetical protein
MNGLSQDELRALVEVSQDPCVSLFMPMEQMGPETRQNPIRFKNLLRQAEEQLVEQGLRRPEALDLLKPVQALDNYEFWQHQLSGLAVFCAQNFIHYYRLPLAPEEFVTVGDRFYFKPLLPLLSDNDQFYLLALSQNQVTLFQGSRFSLQEVDLETLPTSLADALRYNDPEKNLQFRTGITRGGGQQVAAFHGQDADDEVEKIRIVEYFRLIDAGLHGLLRTQQTPLVLAGVEYLFPLYQEANTYAHLLPKGVPGNPEHVQPEELHQQAWDILQPHFMQVQNEAVERYQEFVGTGKASSNVEAVVPAAFNGRVDSLFVAVDQHQWGHFDPTANAVNLHPQRETGDEDLLDFAAIHTFLNRGTIYTVPPETIPEQAPLAAVFRY